MSNDTGVLTRDRRVNDLDMSVSTEDIEPPKKQVGILGKFQKALTDQIRTAVSSKGVAKIAIFTHPSPDPDAIGSQMGLAWFLRKSYDNVEIDCFYDGHISHPQNQRMVNLLDPELKEVADCHISEYDIRVSVDTVPAHAVCPENTSFDFVIDHHKEVPNGGFKGFFLNLKAGSCCATIYQLIKQSNLQFEEDNDFDSKVATALLVGIITDTDYQTSDDTTEFEHSAYAELFDFRNPTALKQITKYKHPREWVQARACVAQKAHDRIKDGVLIHGIGFISGNNRDLIAAVADEMLSWESVETCVAFAVVDGDRIEGSVRSSDAALAVPGLCKDLGGQYGGGGGKLGKGAYFYSLGSCANDGEMDEDTKAKMWEFINEREIKRLHKIIKKS
jgi:nanoRNase/pAp phosphatase (c-di-AMP/oligoRNAs hydrolase)